MKKKSVKNFFLPQQFYSHYEQMFTYLGLLLSITEQNRNTDRQTHIHTIGQINLQKASAQRTNAMKTQNIFIKKILSNRRPIFLFWLINSLTVWRISRNQFGPVCAEIAENSPERKLEMLSSQNRYVDNYKSSNYILILLRIKSLFSNLN